MTTWKQKDRGTKDYDPPCKDCRVLNWMVCPQVENAFDKNIEMEVCYGLKDFGEMLIKAVVAKYWEKSRKEVPE